MQNQIRNQTLMRLTFHKDCFDNAMKVCNFRNTVKGKFKKLSIYRCIFTSLLVLTLFIVTWLWKQRFLIISFVYWIVFPLCCLVLFFLWFVFFDFKLNVKLQYMCACVYVCVWSECVLFALKFSYQLCAAKIIFISNFIAQ